MENNSHNPNSIYKVDQGATEGDAETVSLQASQGAQRSNDGIQRKWNWHNTALIGIGNPWRGDDGAGWTLVEEAIHRGLWNSPHYLVSGDILQVLDVLGNHDRVVIADAYACEDPLQENQQTLLVFDNWSRLKDLQIWNSMVSSHGFGLAKALQLAESLGKLPAAVKVIALPGFNFGQGNGLSNRTQQFIGLALTRFDGSWE